MLVQASGQIDPTPNPACADEPPNWPCPMTNPILGFSEDAPDSYGTVQVMLGQNPIPMRGIGGGAAVGLQHPGPGGTISARLTLNQSASSNPNPGGVVLSWLFSGSYRVSAVAIPSPIRVIESAPEDDGTRTYTVEPLYGLKFLNPFGWNGPPGAPGWFWVPGDTVGEAAPNFDPFWMIPECNNQMSCRFRPPGPGRVQVAASVEMKRARARSGGGGQQCTSLSGCEQASLALHCDKTNPTRGETVTCTARGEPSTATLVIKDWSFEGEPRKDDPLDGTSWSGPMVRSGTITVNATVNGHAQTASATISVAPRDWSGKTPAITVARVPNGDPQNLPRLPEAVMYTHDLGHTSYTTENEETTIISRGPNFDYIYFADVHFRGAAYYSINDQAFAPNSRFQNAQEPNSGSSGSSTHIGGVLYCQQSDVPRQAARVETHEQEHARVYRERFTEIVQAELGRLEALVSKNDQELTDAADALTKRADHEAAERSREVVDDLNGRYVIRFLNSSGHPCRLRNVAGGDLGNAPTN